MNLSPPAQLVADDATVRQLAGDLLRCADRHAERRWVQGIAGIPGAGKSLFAEQLCEAVNRRQRDAAALVPMDGYHLSNCELDRKGLRPFKGAPQTFDAGRYIQLLRRAGDAAGVVSFLVEDRPVHEPVRRDTPEQTIGPKARVVITEGNYLLVDQPPWSELARVLDACWLMQTPLATARAWTIARHVRGGRATDDAQRHYERVDLPNARLVLECMRRPDLILVNARAQ